MKQTLDDFRLLLLLLLLLLARYKDRSLWVQFVLRRRAGDRGLWSKDSSLRVERTWRWHDYVRVAGVMVLGERKTWATRVLSRQEEGNYNLP
jgi:hypothetical protein